MTTTTGTVIRETRSSAGCDQAAASCCASERDRGGETMFGGPPRASSLDQLRNWMYVTETAIEVIETSIAAAPSSLDTDALREHLVELHATRDLTRRAIEHAENEPTGSGTLSEQRLALCVDLEAIDRGITQLEAMIPSASPSHRRALQHELLGYHNARKGTLSTIHKMTMGQHSRGRRAMRSVRPRHCAAQSVRHSRSSRRTARAGAPRAPLLPCCCGDFNERLGPAARRSRSTGNSRSPSTCSATSSARRGTARAAVTFPKWTSFVPDRRRLRGAPWRQRGRDRGRRPVPAGGRRRAVLATGGGGGGTARSSAVPAWRPIVQGRATTCQQHSTQASTQDRGLRRNLCPHCDLRPTSPSLSSRRSRVRVAGSAATRGPRVRGRRTRPSSGCRSSG